MSRYVLPPHDRTLRVTVGWDPPLQTFFGQVVRPATAPHADDTLVAWLGTRAQEIPSVAQLCLQLAAYAAIPSAMQARLAREQLESRPPTALQVRLRQALEQIEQPHDPRKEYAMATPDLDIHLRMRHIARTQAMRPRLRGNLKQLGAVGPVVRPLPATSRRAFVKVQTTKTTTTGPHLSYLQHQKGPEQQDAALFGPAAAARQRFTQEAQHDPHQFRLVLMVREHAQLDLTRYAELFMAQVERDLGRPLDWVAANHCDTEHPHTHIVMRGRDRDGRDLYMERDYFQYGLRARASQLLTWFFGPQRLAEPQLFQQQAAQRLAFNGVPQGLDDPDARNRVAQTMAAVGPDDDRPPGSVVDQQMETQRRTLAQTTEAGRPPADVLAQFRETPPPVGVPLVSTDRTPPAAAMVELSLASRLAALQQAIVEHQARQRGQGLGL